MGALSVAWSCESRYRFCVARRDPSSFWRSPGGVVAALGLGLVAAASAIAVCTKTAAASSSKLHIVGDSQACWCGALATTNPGSIFLSGVTSVGIVDCKFGSRIADWNAHIASIAINPSDYVLIFLGSNEMGNTPDPTTIIKSVLTRGGIPVWVGPPLIRGASGPFIAHVASICSSLGVEYFDSRTINLQQDAARVHPADAQEAARWLNAVLATLA